MRGLYQAVAVACMCIQEQASARPLIQNVVAALSRLTNDWMTFINRTGLVVMYGDRWQNNSGEYFQGMMWDLYGLEKDI